MYLLAVESRDDNSNHYVNIHYVKPVVNRRLRVSTLTLQSDLDTCRLLTSALEKELTGKSPCGQSSQRVARGCRSGRDE